MGFYFIIIVPLLPFCCGFSFVFECRVSFLVGISIFWSMVVQQLVMIPVFSKKEWAHVQLHHLELIYHTEWSKSEREISYDILYMQNLKKKLKWYIWTDIQNRNKLPDLENEIIVMGRGGIVRKFGNWHIHTAAIFFFFSRKSNTLFSTVKLLLKCPKNVYIKAFYSFNCRTIKRFLKWTQQLLF